MCAGANPIIIYLKCSDFCHSAAQRRNLLFASWQVPRSQFLISGLISKQWVGCDNAPSRGEEGGTESILISIYCTSGSCDCFGQNADAASAALVVE